MEREENRYKSAAELVSPLSRDEIDAVGSTAAIEWDYQPAGDIVALVVGLGGRVEYRNFAEEDAGLETIAVHGPGSFEIVLPNHTTPRRDRFTIAHELGHYYLHSQQGKQKMRAGRSGSDRAEWQANWFAAGFLMPKDQFIATYHEASTLSWLARKFGVSEHAARIRCKALGLPIADGD